jgi:hypothetical protein
MEQRDDFVDFCTSYFLEWVIERYECLVGTPSGVAPASSDQLSERLHVTIIQGAPASLQIIADYAVSAFRQPLHIYFSFLGLNGHNAKTICLGLKQESNLQHERAPHLRPHRRSRRKYCLLAAVTKTLIEGGFVTDPFRRIKLTVEYVDAAAGSQKTLTAIRESVKRAAHGTKTILSMPTLELVREMVAFARALSEDRFAGSVPVIEITSREGDEPKRRGRSIPYLIRRHIQGKTATGAPLADVPQGGHILFITHEAAYRMGLEWPAEAQNFEIIIDEEPEVLLTRVPLHLRESFYNLTSFVEAVPTRKFTDASEDVFTDRDVRAMAWCEQMIDPANNASPKEMELAQRKLDELIAKRDNSTMREAMLSSYFQIVPKLDDDPDTDNPMRFVEMRRDMVASDDIYRYFQPLPAWLTQGVACFTARDAWERMVGRMDKAPDRGQM